VSIDEPAKGLRLHYPKRRRGWAHAGDRFLWRSDREGTSPEFDLPYEHDQQFPGSDGGRRML